MTAAAGVILAAQQQGGTAAYIAAALESARLLQSPESAAALGSPWERAVAGLNALVDADVAFHVEPDGHISAPLSNEHIEWDRRASRWVLTRDNEDADPCRPCGCPKRFNRHAEGCPALPAPGAPDIEYRFCGADLGHDEYPYTCNRRIAHQGMCSDEMDAEVTA